MVTGIVHDEDGQDAVSVAGLEEVSLQPLAETVRVHVLVIVNLVLQARLKDEKRGQAIVPLLR